MFHKFLTRRMFAQVHPRKRCPRQRRSTPRPRDQDRFYAKWRKLGKI
jgi:hypothetical protein